MLGLGLGRRGLGEAKSDRTAVQRAKGTVVYQVANGGPWYGWPYICSPSFIAGTHIFTSIKTWRHSLHRCSPKAQDATDG